MKHLHVISPDPLRRNAAKKRLAPAALSMQSYQSVEQASRTLSTLDAGRPHLVVYVPPPKPIEQFSHDLISLLPLRGLGFSVAIICMSTEDALIQSADVLQISKLFYDVKEQLPAQIERVSSGTNSKRGWKVAKKSPLTPRERSVLVGLQAGLSLKEVAANLAISANTVSTYKVRIMQKLGYKNNAELLQGKE